MQLVFYGRAESPANLNWRSIGIRCEWKKGFLSLRTIPLDSWRVETVSISCWTAGQFWSISPQGKPDSWSWRSGPSGRALSGNPFCRLVGWPADRKGERTVGHQPALRGKGLTRGNVRLPRTSLPEEYDSRNWTGIRTGLRSMAACDAVVFYCGVARLWITFNFGSRV